MGGGGTPTDAIGQIVAYLLSLGLPGVCLLALGWAYNKKDKRVDDLQDTLIKMASENATAMVGATAAINSLRDLLIAKGKAE